MMQKADVVIVGGGIVGLAVAYKLLNKFPGLHLVILEKEQAIAQHQTGNNSGVIHSGIYYAPGSLKAKNCVEGSRQLLHFCQEAQIPINTCGKLIIATEQAELERLKTLYQRGLANGVADLKLVSPADIQKIEPCVTLALQGLYSPHTAIINYSAVAQALLQRILERGGRLMTNAACLKIQKQSETLIITTTQGVIECGHLINCGGVWADTIARLAGAVVPERIIPFRGEYYLLNETSASKIHGLIYPVPNPSFPFLGVHLTRMISGGVEAGPNAVLALAKDGYTKTSFSLSHCRDILTYGGFWKMAAKYWRTGLYEVYRSLSKQAFLHSLQRLMPELKSSDLKPGGAGIRAQLVNPNGTLCDDFRIEQMPHMTHVLNAPSPAATSCLAIADTIIAPFMEMEEEA